MPRPRSIPDALAARIKGLVASGLSAAEAARRCGVRAHVARGVACGETYADVAPAAPREERTRHVPQGRAINPFIPEVILRKSRARGPDGEPPPDPYRRAFLVRLSLVVGVRVPPGASPLEVRRRAVRAAGRALMARPVPEWALDGFDRFRPADGQPSAGGWPRRA